MLMLLGVLRLIRGFWLYFSFWLSAAGISSLFIFVSEVIVSLVLLGEVNNRSAIASSVVGLMVNNLGQPEAKSSLDISVGQVSY